MDKGYKKKVVKHIIIVLDFLLLVSFLALSMVAGCLIAYGYVPISAKWANKKLQKIQFDGFHIQADSFHLRVGQKIELIGPRIYHIETTKPILKADSTEIHYGFKRPGSYQLNVTKLIVTNGTLAMPAVYAPDGKRSNVLEKVTFHLSPTESCIRINSFVGKHEDIHLRGSVEWPVAAPKKTRKKTSIQQLYKLIASALKEKAKFSPFIQPTLQFALSTSLDNSIDVSLLLLCEQLRYSQVTGSYFSLGADFVLNQGQLDAQTPLLLRAREITLGDLDISANDIVAHIAKERWPGVLNGALPRFEVSAHRLKTGKIELNTPRIKIDSSAFPVLKFSGTTCGFHGNASFSGAFNSADKSGNVTANGAFDIFELLPDPVVAKLPTLTFGTTPFYNLSADFNQKFDINNARFHINVKDLTANELNFDSIIADGYYRSGILHFEDIRIDREKQWVDGSYHHNTQTKDFQIRLMGSALPKQYNSLLPEWWSNIFQDLHFDQKAPINGDFAIQGKMEKAGEISLFGHARAKNFAYKDAFFDACELVVRNRQNYVEIHDIKARVGEGRATGNLGFTQARSPRTGLISVRYNFDASLPIETASNALGGTVADVLSNLELSGLPDVQVNGVFFSEDFEEYADKDNIYLQAKVDTPLRFYDVPLDHLKLKLIGLDSEIYLRDVQFGYADGIANARADILSIESETPEMRFKMSLRNANQAKAIESIPGTDESSSTTPEAEYEDPARVSGLLDLDIHAKGPLDDLYGFQGYGIVEIRNEALGSIQLLGPLSQILQNTVFNFTSFDLNHIHNIFEIDREQLIIKDLRINGPRTRISATGTFQLPDQALDMDVGVSLFGNVGNPNSAINALGRVITSPLPNLLSFRVTGTIQNQRIRSRLDPRNLIPSFN